MDMRETFNSLKGTGLQQEEFHENMSWDEYVREAAELAEQDKALAKLMSMKRQEERAEAASLQDILSKNFLEAKKIIDVMTIAKRIEMLEEINAYRTYLYSSMERFGGEGISKDEQISAHDFRALLGRVKHMEILMNMLFGII